MIREIELPEDARLAIDLERALDLACEILSSETGKCPEDCTHEKGGCGNIDSECWKRYFIEKARGK